MFSKFTAYLIIILFVQKFQISKSEIDTCEPGKNDVIFLVDTSTSIQESNLPIQTTDNWSYIINFLKKIIEGFKFNSDPALRVGIIPFSTQVDSNFSSVLSNNQSELLSSLTILENRYYGGNTNISGALRQARLTFDQNRGSGRKQIIVLITDGQSNVDEDLTLPTAEQNRQANITHFVIAITPYVNRLELQTIIGINPTFFYFEVNHFENLNTTVQPVLARINCPKPNKVCTDIRADICFLLDSSGSIIQDDKKNYTDWNYMKQFLLDMVDQLTVSKDDSRISLIEFSNNAVIIFDLNFSFSADVIKTKISNISLFGSSTNTQAALTLMYKDVFVESKGDRPDAPNIGIVITDGKSNDYASNTIPAANIAKGLGIRMFALGLTSSIDPTELDGIASLPPEQHVFTRSTFSLLSTVISNLIFNLCHEPCFTNCSDTNRCPDGHHIAWINYPNKKITAHDFRIINGVYSVITCQNNCLQEFSCRSIEYIEKFNICNLSFFTINMVPTTDFVDDITVDYREWVCQKY